jgi:queuine tRNA-ribosyltransferase
VVPDGNTFVDTQYSKAYLRHLVISKEMLGAQIATIHNLGFYLRLMKEIREQIKKCSFRKWKEKMNAKLTERL